MALGWMGARAEYSLRGGITAPTSLGRGKPQPRSKQVSEFFEAPWPLYSTSVYLT